MPDTASSVVAVSADPEPGTADVLKESWLCKIQLLLVTALKLCLMGKSTCALQSHYDVPML